ncbi:hypothetical protein L798_08659 [Zootermopsis nevadensis]|uniref:Uncharacterized protein n=1 Tax=Zootermopsis nevadensis TaxID=136037 RepID=A0A067RI27_ZOONE|nr:hypothetical protein L798_08659 [Zootermopsis nevadensis]
MSPLSVFSIHELQIARSSSAISAIEYTERKAYSDELEFFLYEKSYKPRFIHAVETEGNVLLFLFTPVLKVGGCGCSTNRCDKLVSSMMTSDVNQHFLFSEQTVGILQWTLKA